MKIIALLLILVFGWLSCTKLKASKSEKFWAWFSSHQEELFDFEKNQEEVFDQLSKELRKVDSNLTFEFGPKENGVREFVISADGILSSFPAVETLYAAKPDLKRWQVLKFRPRREASLDLELGGIRITKSDLKFALTKSADPGKVGIAVFIRGYKEEDHPKYIQACFLVLDGLVGEYDMETKVGAIDLYGFDSPHIENAQQMDSLPSKFDAHFAGK
ncbi:MAG: hypothetical protein IPK50_14595 [Fibrobacterota bacterium]|nr:MAG: hypothetical protein IPK50_14595 [Fibrobacterota bacterium]